MTTDALIQDRESLDVCSMTAPLVGRIVSVAADGRASVIFPGAVAPTAARCAVPDVTVSSVDDLVDANVLLLFEGGDPARPIIVGFVRERLWTTAAGPEARRPSPEGPAPSGARTAHVVIEGDRAVVLRCGPASITLTADGRIVIKGTTLTSRASETNKVRGAVVLIN
jgi:hypothetical protein